MAHEKEEQRTVPQDAVTEARTPSSDYVKGLSSAEAKKRLERDGPNEVPEKKQHYVLRFLKKFWGLSAWMIELIALLSIVLHKTTDLVVALLLLLVNAVLSFIQEQRSSAAVAALRRQLNVSVRVLRGGGWSTMPARALVSGDVVRVRAGDFVPADMQVVDGVLRVDQSALTGESREIERTAGDTLYGGATIRRGEGTGIVVATGVHTYFGRTTELVASAHPKLHVEEVIARVVRWLLIIVGTLVAVTLVVSYVKGLPLLDTLPIALVLLMSAVPVALPVMFTVSMALGSMELSRQGVLITQLSGIEDAATMDVLCIDKTGTLTMNQLSLKLVQPQPGFSEDDVLHVAALASNEANADPIDLAFLHAVAGRMQAMTSATTLSFQPFSAATRRTEAVVALNGRTMRCVKGALRTVGESAGLQDEVIQQLESQAKTEAAKGERVLAVAKAECEGPLQLVGLAYLYDAPRPDSGRLIAELRHLGIKVKMLTGDALPVARAIGGTLGLGTIVRVPELHNKVPGTEERPADVTEGVDGYAEVFPEDKFLVVKRLQESGHVVGMTGDGVNDAPALRQAEVGIAVSGASDVAKGAASAVLTHEGLVDIIDLVRSGRAIYQRVLTWIVNKVSRTILKAGFVVVAFLVTGQFVISALGMVLLVFMTDFVKIALSTDRVRPSQKPETWNIVPLVWVAVVLGFLMLVEALALLAYGWHRFALVAGGGRLQTFAFQTLLFFGLFSIISVRERRAFWASRPSLLLMVAIIVDALFGMFIGFHGLAELRPLPPTLSMLILAYTGVLVLGPNDVLKASLTARAEGKLGNERSS
ncbi:plasma-membrane proton-efflux P-type ATPase [Cupriavidus pinatubonensis]|uniref:Magnesium-transporting ATPase, P-type 1 n=1 Tax=Cupriavidus pinatubonensis TaxID=248026 RepID=A0ABM8Y482_9BURK|nr:plasma-membrane proton-efflux P-type ATPase [Cupriavidus pinatubonensis]CAG9187587.1 Magnesium-transporting ATPase, P-type 1 [Cupriavidus pinatubonensis]